MTTITLNDIAIDHLIGARNRITDRVDEKIDFRAVDHIDAVLSTVPHGARADVDALLGRKRIIAVQHRDDTRETATPFGWFVNPAVTIESVKPLADAKLAQYNAYTAELTDDQIALMEEMTRETASEQPTHDGMWK